MQKSLSLRMKIILMFSAIGAVVLAGGVVMLWYTYQSDRLYTTMVHKELVLYKIARDMEVGLANQKGFLTYYLIDGNAKWLNALGQYRQMFKQDIDSAASLQLSDDQGKTLAAIKMKYNEYTAAKDIAIENYQRDQIVSHTSISEVHAKQREVFFNVLSLCQDFSRNQWLSIEQSQQRYSVMSIQLRSTAYMAILLFLFLSALFLYILYKQILEPIRGLAIESGRSYTESSKNEVAS